MSIYRDLRRGNFRVNAARPYRSRRRYTPTIMSNLCGRRREKSNERKPMRYCLRSRRRHRPGSRDRRFEKSRLEEEDKEEMERLEREDKEAEEKRRVQAEKLAALKAECLIVEDLNMHIDKNTQQHHTDLFDCVDDEDDPQLVVRRGQEFELTLTFQRPWIGKQDDMYLIFKTGNSPSFAKETCAKIKLEEGDNTDYKDGENKDWGARIVSQENNDLTIAVYTPPDAIIGEWEYSIRTVKGKKKEEYECEGSVDIILLLNPWCKDDQVYMESELELEEYVLNQHGIAYRGSYYSISEKKWFYGQFDAEVLEICLFLIRMAFDYDISPDMADPVCLARALSRVLNDCDDRGVLSGRWDGEYGAGVAPGTWKSSAAILKKFYQDGTVKYGQCWVFSHLFTAVSRAIGLPCRSITNFASAHDTSLTMTIDTYVDEDGDEVDSKNADSVWNFHVWNECWMLRPDLDKQTKEKGKYDGWHAVDATPQELSDHVYQCGPSPLTAVKAADLHVGYDTKFIFAEVNAEYCTWRDDDPPVCLSRDSRRVGKNISTKDPFGKGRLDVTHLYKNEEGSVAEREAVEKATKQGKLGKYLFKDTTGVKITFPDKGDMEVGDDISLHVKVENTAEETRNVRLRAIVRPLNYWGRLIGTERITSKIFSEEKLEPNESKEYAVPVSAEDYLRCCSTDLALKLLTSVYVRGFDDQVYASDESRLKCPDIEVKSTGDKVKAGEPLELELTMCNPIKTQPLTNCELSIDGSVLVDEPGFEKKDSMYKKAIGTLQPGETKTLKVTVKPTRKPRKSREREVEVGMSCNELADLEGSYSIQLE